MFLKKYLTIEEAAKFLSDENYIVSADDVIELAQQNEIEIGLYIDSDTRRHFFIADCDLEEGWQLHPISLDAEPHKRNEQLKRYARKLYESLKQLDPASIPSFLKNYRKEYAIHSSKSISVSTMLAENKETGQLSFLSNRIIRDDAFDTAKPIFLFNKEQNMAIDLSAESIQADKLFSETGEQFYYLEHWGLLDDKINGFGLFEDLLLHIIDKKTLNKDFLRISKKELQEFKNSFSIEDQNVPKEPYLDSDSEFFAIELSISIEAHKQVLLHGWRSKTKYNGMTEHIKDWVRENYPDASDAFVKRIAYVANPKKKLS